MPGKLAHSARRPRFKGRTSQLTKFQQYKCTDDQYFWFGRDRGLFVIALKCVYSNRGAVIQANKTYSLKGPRNKIFISKVHTKNFVGYHNLIELILQVFTVCLQVWFFFYANRDVIMI